MDEWMHQIAIAITSGDARLIPMKLFNSKVAIFRPNSPKLEPVGSLLPTVNVLIQMPRC